MTGYNPYRTTQLNNEVVSKTDISSGDNNLLKNRNLVNLSRFARDYNLFNIKNAKTFHINEDPNQNSGLFSNIKNKLNAIASESTNIASMKIDYVAKLELFKRYSRETDINYYVSKLANEIITYTKDKKFCTLKSLNEEKYSKSVIQRANTIFLDFYDKLGFNVQSKAYDICFDYLVEGYIVKEIVYDDKRKNIIFFQTVDPTSIYPIIDEETGIKLWVQYPNSSDPRIILDSDIIYISYSGSSKYTDTSYIEPLIKPYNELKGLERTKILFNMQHAVMHKNITVGMADIPKHLQESELLSLMSMTNDHIEYDSYEGITYLNGSKDLPYSKTNWFVDNGGGETKIETEAYNGTDINEDVTLNWFRNNFKQSTKFPITKLDSSTGGGTVYNFGSDVTFEDYNFEQFIELLRSQFQDILIKPIFVQLTMEFPELAEQNLLNDLELEFFSNDEILEAKRLSNLQAKIQIGYELTSNFKDVDGEKPFLHPRLVAEKILNLPKELLELNDIYWKKYNGDISADGDGGGGDMSGGDMGGSDFDMGGDDFDMGGDDGATDDLDTGTDDSQVEETLPEE